MEILLIVIAFRKVYIEDVYKKLLPERYETSVGHPSSPCLQESRVETKHGADGVSYGTVIIWISASTELRFSEFGQII